MLSLLLAVPAAAEDGLDAPPDMSALLRGMRAAEDMPNVPGAPIQTAQLGPLPVAPSRAASRRFLRAGPPVEVETARGAVTLQVEPLGEEAVRALHAARASRLFGGDMRQLEREDAQWHARDVNSSLMLSINRLGWLTGQVRLTGNAYQPWQIWGTDLNDDGRTRRVVITSGARDGARGVCARFLDSRGAEFHRLFITDPQFWDERPPFRAVCGS